MKFYSKLIAVSLSLASLSGCLLSNLGVVKNDPIDSIITTNTQAEPAFSFSHWSSWMKVGTLHCSEKKVIQIVDKDKDFLKMSFNGKSYNLTRKPTSSGAVRYEDLNNGIVFLLLPKKVSLFNTKTSIRMADECVHS